MSTPTELDKLEQLCGIRDRETGGARLFGKMETSLPELFNQVSSDGRKLDQLVGVGQFGGVGAGSSLVVA